MSQNLQHRQYPIGALPAEEVRDILAHPLCRDTITLDALMQDWRLKNQVFRGMPTPNLNATNADLRPLNVSTSVMQRIQDVIKSYRDYLPFSYDLAFVPLDMLITPQKSVLLERARAFASTATRTLSDDENAELCLASPIRVPQIDAKLVWGAINPQNPNQFTYVYQFESDDQDIRFLSIPHLKPRQVNWATDGAPHSLNLETISLSVGLGPPPVQVAKVPVDLVGSSSGFKSPVYRFILWNGVHRAFRLSELGNKYITAIVFEMNHDYFPNLLADTPKAVLFSQRPLIVTDLANPAISRSFDWQKAKKLVRLQVTVTVDNMFVT